VDFAWSDADLAFQRELEGFLDRELPPFIDEWEGDHDAGDDSPSRGVMGVMAKRAAWQRKLNEGRWAAILWPEEHGGRAATVSQNVIYTQVMAR
jgi:alkylation response protein AidB-like acyl-CoA dehydrogenase